MGKETVFCNVRCWKVPPLLPQCCNFLREVIIVLWLARPQCKLLWLEHNGQCKLLVYVTFHNTQNLPGLCNSDFSVWDVPFSGEDAHGHGHVLISPRKVSSCSGAQYHWLEINTSVEYQNGVITSPGHFKSFCSRTPPHLID